ncbi:MAG: gliding motility-associated C-terminal domain-containing protein [Crocinitomicaceae bacterium]|nr:gliding motility-associated C-terminal domain-containing protein [Crocinitomicaceae bacterium]
MNKTKLLSFLLVFLFILYSGKTNAQCGVNVPVITVDLTGAPDSVWVLPESQAPDRLGQCCGASGSDNCIRFDIILDQNCAGIFFEYDSAPGIGSLDWQVDCGPEYDLKDTICISGPGSYTLTFCKPGTDNGNYTLTSVPRPIFPDDQVVPMNCVQPMEVQGVTDDQIVWTSISPGNPGDYDYMLDCTDCLTPTFTPDPNGPTNVEYRVCGYPLMDQCVGALTFCDTVAIEVQDSLLVFTNPPNATFCAGGNAVVNASATGGDGNYSFYWYNSSMTVVGTGSQLITNTPGTYTVEVRDGNYEPGSCDDFFKTFSVSVVQPPTATAGDDQVLCADNPVASIDASYTNAAGVNWSGGAGVFTPNNTDTTFTYLPTQSEIASGSVTLTMLTTGAGGGCVNASDDITIFFVDTIKTNLTDLNLNCSNSTAFVNPTVTGGLAPLTYQWSDGTTATSNTLGQGTHCLTITDGNGCAITDCFIISAPTSLTVAMSSSPATTIGGTEGSATATPAGGTTPYNYSWSSGGTAATENNLGYGIYTVVVTDANGCTANGSVVVNDPVCGGFDANATATPALCFGASDGSIALSLTGGASPFTYLWDDPGAQTTATATGLSAGVYTVTVTDDNGCLAIATAAVIEPDALDNTFTHTDVSLQGGSDGAAQANVTGGTTSYSYLWSNSATTSNISGVPAGWHSVQITDANNCVLVDSVYITEPPCNAFEISVGTTPVLCNGDANGEAVLNIVAGNTPYTINWSTGATSVTSINGLSAGIYTVEVTDAKNCYGFTSFGIAEPSPLSLGMLSVPSTCHGQDNGTIDVTVSGGTFPVYTFLWDNGLTQEDRINLAPGSYSLTVTDNNGCTVNGSVSVVEPDSMILGVSVTNVTCFEGTDGAIDVTLTGGTGVYSYNWSNGSTTQDLSALDVGGYILSIMDGNMCGLTAPVTVSIVQPDKVVADSIKIACPIPGQLTTNVQVYPNGGNPDYEISFDGGTNYLTVGDYIEAMTISQSYNVLVRDVNGCLSDPYPITVDTTVYAALIDYNKCYVSPQTNETITITPAGGTGDYSISLDNGVTFAPVLDYDLLVPIDSTYQLVVLDSRGCYSQTYSVTLTDTMHMDVAITSDYNGANISCFGNTDGSAGATVSGGAAPYTYAWNNGGTTSQITNLIAGTYSVTVTDTNGCQLNAGVTLTQPAQLTALSNVTSNFNGFGISCHGLADGMASGAGSGGTMPYYFAWSNGQNTPNASGLMTGTYSVTITDENGCTAQSSVFLNEPDTLGVTTQITDVSCNGGNDGAIDITVTGGVTPFTYQWSSGQTSEDVTSLPAGIYQVSVLDDNGCNYILNNIVVDPTLIDLDLAVTQITCFEANDGALDLSISGGTLPHSILWTTGDTTEDLSNLAIGYYSVTVTDGNGCYTDINATITQPDLLWADLSTPTFYHGHNVSDHGMSDGEVNVIVSGGTMPYVFSWSNGDSTQDLTGIGAGTYVLYLVDSNGCSFTDSIELTEPYALQIPTGITPNGDGKNDYLVIRGLEVYPNSHVTILNQWGNVVYENSDYQNDWGGTNKSGADLPDGTYFVILELENGEKLNSYLDLRRK